MYFWKGNNIAQTLTFSVTLKNALMLTVRQDLASSF